jgi:hypothetical protein
MKYLGRYLDPIDAAWAAGFLDGEGCFTILLKKQNDKRLDGSRGGRGVTYRPLIAAAQISQKPLLKLQQMFGGNLRLIVNSGARRDVWHWQLEGGGKIAQATQVLIPYLVVKKSQARVLLEFTLGTGTKGPSVISNEEWGRRAKLAKRIKALK